MHNKMGHTDENLLNRVDFSTAPLIWKLDTIYCMAQNHNATFKWLSRYVYWLQGHLGEKSLEMSPQIHTRNNMGILRTQRQPILQAMETPTICLHSYKLQNEVELQSKSKEKHFIGHKKRTA